ncbi:MAG TPA: response regulator [Novosphingobium sp.]|nr:response regulator [Novosphingobium sp.]
MDDTTTQRLVHIIDDDPEILDSVSFMLGTDGIATTTFACSEDFLAALPEMNPGCILLDVRMPGMNGLQLQRHLHEHGCRMPVIFMTGHGDVTTAVAAMKEGAIDFIQKPFSRADRQSSAEAAGADPAQAHRAASLIEALTRREQQVLEGLLKGHANKVIAFDLDISPRTVELYRANAMKKLKARSLSEMLQIAFVAGFSPGRQLS